MPYIDDIDAPQFFSADACKAAGIDNATLKNWITRSPPAILVSDEDRAAFADIGVTGPSYERLAAGSGRSHLFTYRRVMQIALTAELVRLGFPPRKAGMVAAGFTDVGDGSGGWGDEPIPIGRLPGELYQNGITVLIAAAEGETGRTMNVDINTPLLNVFFSKSPRPSTAVIIDVNTVNDRVLGSLGLDRNWFRRTGRKARRAATTTGLASDGEQ